MRRMGQLIRASAIHIGGWRALPHPIIYDTIKGILLVKHESDYRRVF